MCHRAHGVSSSSACRWAHLQLLERRTVRFLRSYGEYLWLVLRGLYCGKYRNVNNQTCLNDSVRSSASPADLLPDLAVVRQFRSPSLPVYSVFARKTFIYGYRWPLRLCSGERFFPRVMEYQDVKPLFTITSENTGISGCLSGSSILSRNRRSYGCARSVPGPFPSTIALQGYCDRASSTERKSDNYVLFRGLRGSYDRSGSQS